MQENCYKTFKLLLEEEQKCPGGCGYETAVAFVLAKDEEDAKERLEQGEWSCANCLADDLVEAQAKVCFD